jgi:hypothetical protein
MNKSHQNRSKSFDELNFKEQAQAINMHRLILKRMEKAHERRRRELGK